ncbi:helix-turn-helix domain-containing protein [Streptomyces sp. LHD-70]|uniref:helix-turn-helix domain-containing protein n=1 Tax=Streptomyces sp. LHD-70 TaxID=3072140 RepID=UPI00280D31C4|nr:helix-turn-helix domain-containing protein [Streptomyces sp. LHD-70]MDQ8704545.1 helix-turn-helix domain-containing protein [Streptomyces sp. LHD-70]
MLQALGLGPDEEAVYNALLPRPSASAQDLARQAGLEQGETIRILRELAARGLVLVTPETDCAASAPVRCGADGPATRYRLSPPSVALAPLLVEQRNALHRAETAFAMLTEQYRSTAAHPAGSVVEVVVGVEQVAHRFHQLQRGARRELLTFLVGAPTAVPREDTDVVEHAALDRGVDFRVVATRDYLDGHEVAQDIRAAIAAGMELRLVEALPLKLVVADRESAMVPLDVADSGDEPSAIVVHRSGLLTALVHLFEQEWAQARPLYDTATGVRVRAEADQWPTVGEREVLALLLAGFSDRRAASQLGVSIRTVERRTRRLMDLAGVDSRLQLGWYAARAGWL